jgi:hypothetical protein
MMVDTLGGSGSIGLSSSVDEGLSLSLPRTRGRYQRQS